MSAVDESTVQDHQLEEWTEPSSPKRRRPAPKANPFFRFVFPLVIAGLGIWVLMLWREGTKAVLDSTDGTLVEVVTDPDLPGYQVFVDPTPTMLVVHTHHGELVGVTVLARTLLDNGGKGVLLGADLVVTDDVTLGERWESGGIEAVETDVGTLFGFGFLETDVIDTPEFGLLLELVEPLSFALLDDLVVSADDGGASTFLEAGGLELSGDDAARLYGWRNPGEFESNRTERQLDLWDSWLLAVAASDDLDAATLPFDDGLPPYLRAFAGGQADVSIVPAIPQRAGVGAVFVLDERGLSWVADTAEQMVPLPVAPIGSAMPSVRLLDGTGDTDNRDDALDVLADLSEVVVLGNAGEFGIERTQVIHYTSADQDAAVALAEELGAEVVFDDQPDQPVDLTVVIGTDWEAP